jgi:2-polyprenyl-6-methoxyphenol hydroxylase-like FAD-dependent oxidoreductase
MKPLPSKTEITIVGAGPTGLSLACVLAKEKIPFLLLDQLEEGLNTSRAVALHARSLEVLEELEVTDCLLAEGLAVPKFTIRDRDKVLASIHFDQLPTRYPFVLAIPQNITESVLLARLRELGGNVNRRYKVVILSQDSKSVTLTALTDKGRIKEIRSRYVVGADGMHSIVRDHAGIGFTGETYEELFVLADVRMNRQLSTGEVKIFFSHDGPLVIVPLPKNQFRVMAMVEKAQEQPDITDVQYLLDTRGPVSKKTRIEEIIWSSRFHIYQRIADNYKKGNVMLAGDAAHVHSPAGGQGMNTGIQDAMVLGHILAEVLSGRSGEELLESYEEKRRPIGLHVGALTDYMTRTATLRNRWLQLIRNSLLPLGSHISVVERGIARELAELRYK